VSGCGRQRRCLALCALAALAAGTFSAGAAKADPFCESRTVRNYMKPLEAMPKLPAAPLTDRLPFGPRNVFFSRIGQGPLVIGGDEIGFGLDYSEIATKPTGRRLAWIVTAKLSRAIAGNDWEAIDSRQLRGLSFPSGHGLSFVVSGKPAIYRIEVVFRNGSGEKLGRYGQYFRVLRSTLDAQLTLDKRAFYPGEIVAPWLDNYGTEPLFYGLAYSIESFNGSGWERASIAPSGIVPLIGLWSGPGESASCWRFTVPADAPPGLYRFVWNGNVTRAGSIPQRRPLTLTTEFEILPTP
jgi:hypothetical protein